MRNQCPNNIYEADPGHVSGRCAARFPTFVIRIFEKGGAIYKKVPQKPYEIKLRDSESPYKDEGG